MHQRIEKYIHNKWQDRLFFKTSYLEDLIDRVKHECENKKNERMSILTIEWMMVTAFDNELQTPFQLEKM